MTKGEYRNYLDRFLINENAQYGANCEPESDETKFDYRYVRITDIDDDASEEKHKALPMSENISKEMKSLILWMMQTDRNQRPQIIKEVTSYLTVPVDVDEETITINRNNGVFSYESDKRFDYCIKYFIRRNEWLKPVSILVTIIASILLACFILIPLELEYSKLPYKSMIALLIFIPFSIQPIIDKAEDKFFWKYFGVWVAYLSTIILLKFRK